MSTEFIVPFGQTSEFPQLEICEQSSRFTVTAYAEIDGTVSVAQDISPETLIQAAMRMVQIALYHVEDVDRTKLRIRRIIEDMIA